MVRNIWKYDVDLSARETSRSSLTYGASFHWVQKPRLFKMSFLLANTNPSITGSLRRRRQRSLTWRAKRDTMELRGSTIVIIKGNSNRFTLQDQNEDYFQLEEIAGANEAVPYRSRTCSGCYAFKIKLVSGKTLHLAAGSTEIRKRWIDELNNARIEHGPLELRFISTIGAGHFGKVVLAQRRTAKRLQDLYAIKEIKLNDKEPIRGALTERLLLVNLPDHPFVISLQFCFRNGNFIYYGFDFKPGADLFEFLRRQRIKMDLYAARFYMSQIVLALRHMHMHQIVYRDLKPENILVDADGYLCLADVGLSKRLPMGGKTFTVCGTRPYLAPEMINKNAGGYDYSVDFWQLGCFLYELYAGRGPFWTSPKNHQPKVDGSVTALKILSGNFSRPKRIDSRGYDLVQELLTVDPKERIGSADSVPSYLVGNERLIARWKSVESHSFFENIDWDLVYKKKMIPPSKPNSIQDCDENELVLNFNKRFLDEKPIWGADEEISNGKMEKLSHEEELNWFNWTRPVYSSV